MFTFFDIFSKKVRPPPFQKARHGPESNEEFIKRKKQYYENKKGNYQKNDRDHRDLYRENEYNYFCEQCSYNGTSTNQLKKHIESSHKVKKQIEKFTHAPEKVLQKQIFELPLSINLD